MPTIRNGFFIIAVKIKSIGAVVVRFVLIRVSCNRFAKVVNGFFVFSFLVRVKTTRYSAMKV